MSGKSLAGPLIAATLLITVPATALSGERAGPVEFFDVERMHPSSVATAARAGQPVHLHYFDETHRLVLEPSNLRSRHFRASAGTVWEERKIYPGPPSTFEGRVAGDPGSMVRLSITPRGIRASIKSAEGWAFIEPLDPQDAGEPGTDGELHRVFTEADLDADFGAWMAGDMVRITGEHAAGAELDETVGGTGPDYSTEPAANGATTGLRILELAVDADPEYVEACRSRAISPVDEIESVLNVVDGIYQAELGIRLSLTYVHLWESEPDPYTSLDGLTLLREMRDYWNANRQDVHRDMVHLFTGKDLDGSTVGMAYVSVACSLSYAYGLSQDLGNANTVLPILVAHEMGHNLGAGHDPEGSTPRYVMYPSLSALNLDEFSQLTAGQVQDYVSRVSCLALEEEPSPPPPDNTDGDQGSGGEDTTETSGGGGGGGPVDPLLGLLLLTAWLSRQAASRRTPE